MYFYVTTCKLLHSIRMSYELWVDIINSEIKYLKKLNFCAPSCSSSCLCLQGSAKLEKAEILQMTVDHLKMLQATGGKGKELIGF